MLVRALEVQVGRPAQLGPRLEHGRVAAPRVEPDVEDVRLLPEVARPRTRRSACPAGSSSRPAARPRVRCPRPPRMISATCSIDALLEEDARRSPRSRTRRSARPTRAGARCTSPGGARSCCGCAPRPTRGIQRTSFRMASSARWRRPSLVERDEPLLGGAEERRVLAAPAVRVVVGDGDRGDERADARGGASMIFGFASHTVSPAKSLDLRRRSGRRRPPGCRSRRPGRAAEVVVLLAVPGRGVHEPGARVHRHEVRGQPPAASRCDPRVARTPCRRGRCPAARRPVAAPRGRARRRRPANASPASARRDDQPLAVDARPPCRLGPGARRWRGSRAASTASSSRSTSDARRPPSAAASAGERRVTGNFT